MTDSMNAPTRFSVSLSKLKRWSVGSYVASTWYWPEKDIRPLSAAIKRIVRPVARTEQEAASSQMITLRFDGNMQERAREPDAEDINGSLFYADPGNLVYSKIDLRNGAVGLVPADLGRVAVTGEYPVYEITKEADPHYVFLLLRTLKFRRIINSLTSGTSGRKRVPPEVLEREEVPLPGLAIQRRIVAIWEKASRRVEDARRRVGELAHELDGRLKSLADMTPLTARRVSARWWGMGAWGMRSARAAEFAARNPEFRPMKDFAVDATEVIDPRTRPQHEWPVYGVSNKEGVFFSHTQPGEGFKSNYKHIRETYFFHNPTRANVGSLGIVPEVPEDAIASPEYQVWRIKDESPPEYYALLISTDFFLSLVDVHRVGAVKQRLYVENLLNIPIPVLSIGEQRRYAVDRKARLELLREARQELGRAEQEVEDMISGHTDRRG